MTGTITMPDGTVIPVTALMLNTIKGQIQATSRITPASGVYARQHAREEGHLKLADGRQAKVRLGGVRPSNPVPGQDPSEVFHFQLVEGWD
jgi:hypothetical protein